VLAARLPPIDDLRRLLIPTTTPAKMSINWRRDLEHLQHHVRTGADLWITKDKKGIYQLSSQGDSLPSRRMGFHAGRSS